MTLIDFGTLRPARKPTKKERARYQRWVKYLTDSRLSKDEIHKRAAQFTTQGKEPEQ